MRFGMLLRQGLFFVNSLGKSFLLHVFISICVILSSEVFFAYCSIKYE